jgi:hypothetical protein
MDDHVAKPIDAKALFDAIFAAAQSPAALTESAASGR